MRHDEILDVLELKVLQVLTDVQVLPDLLVLPVLQQITDVEVPTVLQILFTISTSTPGFSGNHRSRGTPSSTNTAFQIYRYSQFYT